MDNTLISRVAVVLFAIVIAVFGLFHFIDPENLILFVPSYMPSSHMWVYIMGSLLIVTALSIILNVRVKLATYVLALLLVSFALAIHLQGYLSLSDKQLKALSFLNMIQDLALACCVLYIGATAHTRPVVVFKKNESLAASPATA
jgi:putative oxidoreductase